MNSNGTNVVHNAISEHKSPQRSQAPPAHCHNGSNSTLKSPTSTAAAPQALASPSTAHCNGNNHLAMAAASLLSQAAASILSRSQSPPGVNSTPAHQNVSSVASSSFNVSNIYGNNRNDLPVEAHGRTCPLKSPSPSKNALNDNNSMIEALTKAVAASDGYNTSSPRLPQQAKPIHSLPSSPASHLKSSNHQRHVAAGHSSAHKKISVKTAAKKASVYDFNDDKNLAVISNQKKNNRPSTPSKKATNVKKRKLLRDVDDAEGDGIEGGEVEADEWMESLQPFTNKLYLRFNWKLPRRKADNPFVSAEHRTSSPSSNGYVMKAPKVMMMKKSTKRKSR